MYLMLYNIAGVAMIGWLLLILVPTWKGTRWIAETAVFPIFLSILYLVGIVPLMVASGPEIVGDFGSAEGVLRLLADPEVALIAWIHILAFDQAVALLIYRDNMQHRYVPVAVQSVLLFATLMFGPVGFLSYWVLRAIRRAGQRERAPAPEPAIAGVGQPGVGATLRAAVAGAVGVYRREWVMTAGGILGIAAGIGCGIAILLRGSPFVAPEGHLEKAMAFNIAVGIYVLSIVLLTPLAGFTRRGIRVWQWTIGAIFLYAYTIETVQIARGIDPRFTQAGTATDQILGGVFFLSALGMIATFTILAWKLVRRPAKGELGPLVLSARYAALATFGAFAAGMWMSLVAGPRVGDVSILPLHAVGFHGLQALPLVALLLAWARVPADRAKAWVHGAGVAWAAVCAAVAWQITHGRPVTEASPAMLAAAAALLVWAAIAGAAAVAWVRQMRTGAGGMKGVRPAAA